MLSSSSPNSSDHHMPDPGNSTPARLSAWCQVWRLPAITVVALALVDQLTKYAIVDSETLARQEIVQVIPGFFRIVHVRNPGAVWGIFSNQTQVLSFISLVVFVAILAMFPRFVNGFIERGIAMSLILSGILGNLIDRILRGNVVDFLSFYYKRWEWPSFNVADSCICIGVGIYLISCWTRNEGKVADDMQAPATGS